MIRVLHNARTVGLVAALLLSGPGAYAQPDDPGIVFSTAADLDRGSPGLPGETEPSAGPRSRVGAAATSLTPGRLCLAASAQAVVDGKPIVISLPPAASFQVGELGRSYWDDPPVDETGWQLWAYSMRWAQSVAHRAYRDGQSEALRRVVEQVLRFYVDHPDTGAATKGWQEGTSLRRLETLNCLYAASRDPRLTNAMAAEVAVQTGPRYYGPPNTAVHNHGLMANIRLVVAGRLTGRPAWVAAATSRMRREAPLAFTPQGMTYEQAASYQLVNLHLWEQAAMLLSETSPADPAITTIRGITAKATQVAKWLTEPDGAIVQIGDSSREPGVRSRSTRAGVYRDDRAGVLAGRWSWTDPRTSYYTFRYGPRRWAHGHFDKAAVTWTTRGSRVLVDNGYRTVTAGDRNPWHRIPEAHNVAVPYTGAFDPRGIGSLTSSSFKSSAHRFVAVDSMFTRPHTRTVDVNHALGRIAVNDYFPNTRNRQYWLLDPGWKVASAPKNAKVLRFRNAKGQTLTVTTNGALSGILRGSTTPFAGWTFPDTDRPEAANQIVIRSMRGSVNTSFTVS